MRKLAELLVASSFRLLRFRLLWDWLLRLFRLPAFDYLADWISKGSGELGNVCLVVGGGRNREWRNVDVVSVAGTLTVL